jgi:ribokinase
MKILSFGSLNIDEVYLVEHFAGPGETIPSIARSVFAGGKGLNQSIALRKAGVPVWHAGKIGSEGEMLKETMRSAGVDVSFVMESQIATGRAVIQVDRTGQNCIILYGGANLDMDERCITETLGHFHEGDLLLLQNETSHVGWMMAQAYERGLQIAFNPSPISPQINSYPLEYVTWFILNEAEGYRMTGEKEPEKIMQSFRERYPSCAVVLTLGDRGVVYADREQSEYFGIFNVEVVDTTGAGDTFAGYFLAGIVRNLSIHEILKQASGAAAIAVSRMGASSSIPTHKEVLDFLKER